MATPVSAMRTRGARPNVEECGLGALLSGVIWAQERERKDLVGTSLRERRVWKHWYVDNSVLHSFYCGVCVCVCMRVYVCVSVRSNHGTHV